MGNNCLVTGASGGIGREFARVFAKNGYNLILVARSRDKLETIKLELEAAYGIQAIVCPADLSSKEEIDRLYAEIHAFGHQVDILVNNAGFGEMGAFLDCDWQRQQDLINLNITALARLSYLYGNDMRKRGSGRIINLSSVAAFSAGPYMSLYYASKSFVLSFSQALSEELRGTGVTVTALCPGPTATGFEQNAHMGHSVMFSRFKPASAEEVAKAGYAAAMRGKRVKYHGIVTYAFNMATRLISRSAASAMAAGMNRIKNK